MITFPNAKINLGLAVVLRRPDSYHNIETVFYPVNLYDALEVVPAKEGKTSFSLTGLPVDGLPENNLVIKALNLLKQDFDIPEIDIYLYKNIPFGAGLGGGSSDAAFMLKLLNDFAGLHLSVEQLEVYAAQIGADCPFFIRNEPVFAEGTGNEFSPVNLSLEGYHWVIVKPDIHVSTRDAYARVNPRQPEVSLRDKIQLPVSQWKDKLVNDFEPGIFALHPFIGDIKRQLYGLGAVYACMSGSGSSVFGIFETKPDIEGLFSDCSVYFSAFTRKDA
jgi:4-diphosphocytidyl-2-C-methyl-D-erythritol kinase